MICVKIDLDKFKKKEKQIHKKKRAEEYVVGIKTEQFLF